VDPSALTAFGLCLQTALSSRSFFEDHSFSEADVQRYKEDLQFFASLRKIARQTHFYLGRRHMLKVQLAQGEPPSVRLWRGRLEITTAKRDALIVRHLLENWYRERAADVFTRVIADMAPRLGVRRGLPRSRLLSMRTQWGSCSPKGEVLLNPHLVKAPKACIEYVVAHELCHLKEHNHSERFYRQLGRLLPDWAVRKAELDNLAELLLNR
jgi:predicted metal-dependent hydrolase